MRPSSEGQGSFWVTPVLSNGSSLPAAPTVPGGTSAIPAVDAENASKEQGNSTHRGVVFNTLMLSQQPLYHSDLPLQQRATLLYGVSSTPTAHLSYSFL